MVIRAYISLLTRWANLFLGRSYYHVAQPIGKHFNGHQLSGYYNDLTEKANWKGESDEKGIPINVLTNRKKVYFPITIAQMALGAYDLWLQSGESKNKSKFVELADWLKRNQDEEGGWNNPWNYLRPSCVSNYSAMAQGEAISVLVRAFVLTDQTPYLDSAKRAFHLLVKPVEEGGCSLYINDGVYLEEYPEMPRSTVLNGWIYAVFGLYDLMLLTKDKLAQNILAKTLKTLENSLISYDSGYWTYYDLYGNIASPSYHSVHIVLLDALYIITGIDNFRNFSNRWKNYEKNFLNRSKALAIKGWQKLRKPAKVMILR